MTKSTRDFMFEYPLNHKVIRDLKIVTEFVGNLNVEGKGYIDPSASRLDIFDRYSVDIDFIKWKGTDIKPVLEVCGSLDDIIEAAVRHLADRYEQSMERAA